MQIIKDSLKTVLVSLITLSVIGLAYAWTEPASNPPSGNTAAPLTTKGGQIVEGGLILGHSLAGSNGLVVENGDVVIKGNILVQDASGTARAQIKTDGTIIGTVTTAPIVTMSAVSPIIKGQSSTITVSISGSPANTCAYTNISSSSTASGTYTVSPTATTTYGVTCSNGAGSNSASASVVVNLPASPSVSVFVSPTSIAYDGPSQNVTLNVTISGAPTSCSYDWNGGLSGIVSGSYTATIVGPTKNDSYNYKVTCSNDGGSNSSTATVTTNKNADGDGDGYSTNSGDCANYDSSQKPGGALQYNSGRDGDCNGVKENTKNCGATGWKENNGEPDSVTASCDGLMWEGVACDVGNLNGFSVSSPSVGAIISNADDVKPYISCGAGDWGGDDATPYFYCGTDTDTQANNIMSGYNMTYQGFFGSLIYFKLISGAIVINANDVINFTTYCN